MRILLSHFKQSVDSASSTTLAQEDCAWPRLVRFSSVGRGPTSATETSLQLDLVSGLSFVGSQTARLVIQQFQTVAEDIFIWSVGPKCSVNRPFNCALEILLPTLFT